MIDMRARIDAQREHRSKNPGRIGLKINLYHGYELEAVAAAAEAAKLVPNPIECFMVGDSYLTTHLGRPSTRLGPSEWDWALNLMVSLVAEVRRALDRAYAGADRPYLLADFPDGATRTPDQAIEAAQRFADAGAEAVKLEIASSADHLTLETLVAHGFPVVAHLGYTPQHNKLRRYGGTVEELYQLCRAARAVRNLGAVALVLEMVTETANRLLSHPRGLTTYSIFSGKADLGGQSLNVWDAVFRPASPSKYFPPTATLDAATDRARYGPATTVPAMTQLLRMTVEGEFPPSPPGDDVVATLFDPWREGFLATLLDPRKAVRLVGAS
jgi:ketopantoate hydroxymethyltransferase